MHLSNFPVEIIENICSYLGGDAYVARMVPYLRPCIRDCSKEDYMVSVYEREDFATIYLYNLFPNYKNIERCVAAAVSRENLTILGWLLAKSQNKLLPMIGEQAALHASYKVLTWAMQQGCPVTQYMMISIIRRARLRPPREDVGKLYKFLDFLGYICTRGIGEAVLSGDTEILSCFDLDGCFESVCYGFARGGHLEKLKSFRERGPFSPGKTLQGACFGLQQEVVLWLKEEWDNEYLDFVLSGKESEEEKLSFLHFLDDLFPLDFRQLCLQLRGKGYMNILRWCLDKLGEERTNNIFTVACRNKVQDMDYLFSLGYYKENSHDYFPTMESRRVENLEWLRKKGCPIPRDLAWWSVKRGGKGSLVPCYEWCLKQGLELPNKLSLDCIIENEMDLFHWLLDKVDLCEAARACVGMSITFHNLEAFSLLIVHDHSGSAEKEIEHKKKTYSNYLLLEEMERLVKLHQIN